jgi:uncharacterized OB-fold protein
MTTKTAVPAVDGWFTTDGGEPTLIGARCDTCGTYLFPPTSTSFCPNPTCDGRDLAAVELSRTGTIWSYTDARYQPPPPYVVPGEEHEPFAIAAVELTAEGLVVLGQVVPGVGVDQLKVGDQVQLVVDTLFEDDEHAYTVWKWAPVGSDAAQAPAGAAR